MKQVDAQKLAAKIKTEYGISEQAAFEKAAQIQQDCPEQLAQNVCEWVEDRPLTDIFVDGYSLPMILYIWGNRDFLRAFHLMQMVVNGETKQAEPAITFVRVYMPR